jgi:hypothetical protein
MPAQQLFTDFPAALKGVPGMVSPDTTADIMPSMNIGDLTAAYALQRRMKADRESDWARAAAINSARAAQANAAKSQGNYLPPTASETSGMGYGENTSGVQNPVMWAPRNLQGGALGTWADQQQQRAIKENRPLPMILQAHTGDPYSPGESGGGVVSGRGLYGPGFTSPLGGANPLVWAQMWKERNSAAAPSYSGGGGDSGGPPFHYDMFGGR